MGAIRNIDFTREDMIKECFLVSRESKGGFDFETISNLSFNEYRMIVEHAYSLQPKDGGVNQDG